jgi:cyclopropane fatty-acyl-phospholipid synthase-like methyltransferase
MDTLERSAIAHDGLAFQSPLDENRVQALVERLPLAPGDRVVDLGCGTAELLIRLVERHAVRAVGIDLSPYFLAEGRAQAARRIPDGHLELREEDAARADLERGAFALAVCVGAGAIFGDTGETLRALAALVPRGGLVLLGEGYWRRAPSPAYLAALGAEPDELTSLQGTAAAGVAQGLELVELLESTEADWERYERRWAENGRRWATDHPDHPDREELLAWIENGRRRFERLGGRETLGFALFLLRKG